VNVSITPLDPIAENVFHSTTINHGTGLLPLMLTNVNRAIATAFLSGVILMRTCTVRRVTEVTALIVETTHSARTVNVVVIITSAVAALIVVNRATVILLDQ